MRISESRYIAGQTQNQQNQDESGRPSLQVSVNNNFVEREKKISPTNKVVSKQLSLDNSMESSVHSESNNA